MTIRNGSTPEPRKAIRRTCPAWLLVTDNEWKAARDGFGAPDIVVKSAPYTMPAQHQDVWWRPMSDIPLTEPRWAKLVEIRQST